MWSPSVPVFSPTRSILHIKSEIVVLDINKMALLPSHLLGLSSKSPFFKCAFIDHLTQNLQRLSFSL